MKALAVLQLILAAVNVFLWIGYRRERKQVQRAAPRLSESMKAGRSLVLDGCTCPETEDGQWIHHRAKCPWAM
jgi:hypothetical protein